MPDLRNKNAIVTGGSNGIGYETAKMLASKGCNVAILARNKQKLNLAKTEIEKFGVQCIAIEVDVLFKSQIEESFRLISSLWGEIHILINNVGGGGRWGSPNILETSDEVWSEVYDKNLTAALRYTRFVIPYMKRQKWGRVITITSTLGRQAGGRPWFNIAKTAQTCLMKNLALNKDLVSSGITFNTVAPGCIMIPNTGWEKEKNNNPSEFKKMVENNFPLGRLGRPDEVAYAIVMLCSPQASLINGAALAVDGGESVCF